MASIMRYTTATSVACCMTTELNALAAGSNATGSTIANSASRYLFADFELYLGIGASVAAGGYQSLYLIKSVDGTNYEYGSATVDPPISALVGIFQNPAVAASTACRMTLERVPLPNTTFKPVISNDNASGATNATGNELRVIFYSEEVY